MLKLSGFVTLDELHEGRRSLVVRARRTADNVEVALKTTIDEHPSAADSARIEADFAIANRLSHEHVIRVLGLERHGHRPVVVLQNGGVSLDCATLPLSPKETLRVGIQIAKALIAIHDAGIVHRDINPSNILRDNQRVVRICDFSSASLQSHINNRWHGDGEFDSTLHYASPEQTGRMSRSIDHRSDLYSLGATLYHLLVAQVPFPSADPLEALHAHLAKLPIDPRQHVADIPSALAEIVLKLLQKQPETRYQSAAAVLADFEAVLARLDAGDPTGSVKIGVRDHAARLTIPNKLYGRKAVIDALTKEFEAANSGQNRLVLISGHMGVGKSSLAHHIGRRALQQNAWFVHGKFEQLRRHIPHFGLRQALSALVEQLLATDEHTLMRYRDGLNQSLGTEAAFLTHMLPTLSLLVDTPWSKSGIPVVEAEPRLHRSLRRFLRCFARPDSALVIFLDDLQWADEASLRALAHLHHSGDLGHVLLIGAYRTDEALPESPLGHLLQEVVDDETVHPIVLEGLATDAVLNMISDAMQMPVKQIHGLGTVLHAKTLGNPLFTRQYLSALYQDGLLRINKTTGEWEWDETAIATRQLADNVADLLLSKLRRQSQAVQALLKVAACIGSQFSIRTLATLVESDMLSVAKTLVPAIDDGLIMPVDSTFEQLLSQSERQSGAAPSGEAWCRFQHDRIQHAAHCWLSDTERAQKRLRLGRFLLQQLSVTESEQRVFEITDHINAGIALVADLEERRSFARLNLAAGEHARSIGAYRVGLDYTEQGLALLPKDAWQTSHALMFELALGRLQCACLVHADLSLIEQISDELLEHARDYIQRARVLIWSVDQLGARGHADQALAHGLPILEQLGVNLRVSNYREAMRESWHQSRAIIGNRTIAEAIRDTPQNRDAAHNAAIELFLKLGSPMYSTRPELVSLGALETLRLSLMHGNALGSGVCIAAAGMEVAHELEEYESGYALGQAGSELAESQGSFAASARLLWAGYTRWLKQPFSENIEIHVKGFEQCLELGDFVFASKHAAMLMQTMILVGSPLSTTAQYLATCLDALGHTELEELHICRISSRFIERLCSETPIETAVAVADDADRSLSEQMQQLPFPQGLHWYHLLRCKSLILAGQPNAALRHARESARSAPNDLFSTRELSYCTAIALALMYEQDTSAQRTRWKNELQRISGEVRHWAEIIEPKNYRHKLTLVEAEVARIDGELDQAEFLYDRAVVLAREYGFTYDEALASERATQLALNRGFDDLARSHMRNAVYCYDKWGARAKCVQLQTTYRDLISGNTGEHTQLVDSLGIQPMPSRSVDPRIFDAFSLIKASQALSAEMVFERLLQKLLRTLIEIGGAERGVLLLENDEGKLQVCAVSSVASHEVRLADPVPLAETTLLSRGVANYVLRTREDVVLRDASEAEAFSHDSYIRQGKVRSVLCARIVSTGKLIGMVWLENNMVCGAFSLQRLEVVRLLAAQAAISLQNARLFDSLSQHSAEIARLREQLEAENAFLREKVKSALAFGNIVGDSQPMRQILQQVRLVAPTNASVLITGESGTGKELIANAIHERSERKHRAFVAVNCASIPKELFESEFFGHVRGAFTGAVKDRVGRFQLADGGTLFLDEVAEIPLELQGKLLRVLQEGVFERVGEGRPRRANVRIVAATNRELAVEIEQGTFRQDLYYRLGVFPIHVPALRDRPSDIPALIKHFLRLSAQQLGVPEPRLTQQHIDELQRYSWPGNVRELQNVVERALITAPANGLSFAVPTQNAKGRTAAQHPNVHVTRPLAEPEVLTLVQLRDLERTNIIRALERAHWKIAGKSGAAALLGTKPSTLTSRMKAMGIVRPDA